MTEVAGKLALVTGGVSGLGLGISRYLVSCGATVVMTYRRQERVDEALSHFSSFRDRVDVVHMDVTDRDSVAAAACTIGKKWGDVQLLFNNAGVTLFGPMEEATHADWDWILGVNLGGVVNVLVEFLPQTLGHGKEGHIVNVASMAGIVGGSMAGIYTTSKFAVRGLTESLRVSLRKYGTGVSLLCPGAVRTRIHESVRRRPDQFANSGYRVDDAMIDRWRRWHEPAMDPLDAGRLAVEGVREDRFYIFTHSGFQDVFRSRIAEMLEAFPDQYDGRL